MHFHLFIGVLESEMTYNRMSRLRPKMAILEAVEGGKKILAHVFLGLFGAQGPQKHENQKLNIVASEVSRCRGSHGGP